MVSFHFWMNYIYKTVWVYILVFSNFALVYWQNTMSCQFFIAFSYYSCPSLRGIYPRRWAICFTFKNTWDVSYHTHRHHKLLNLASSLQSPFWVTHRYEVNLWESVFPSLGTALELCESNGEGGDAVHYGSSQHTAGGGLHTALGRQGSVGLLGDQPGAYIRSDLLNSPFSHADFSPSLSRLSIALSA